MGFFDHDTVSVVSRKSHKSHDGRPKYKVERRKKSRSRSRSRSRSPRRESRSLASAIFGGGSKHHSSKHHHSGGSSIFGGGHGGKHHSSSRSSFFGIPTGGGSRSSLFGFGRSSPSSFYKRSPRKNFISRALKKVKHLLRDLVRYAKRHPMKVFMLAIVPLVTSGALIALLARVGLKLPASFEKLVATAGKFASGDSVGLMGEAMKMAGGLTGK